MHIFFQFIDDQYMYICFIQEAHYTNSMLKSWIKESNYDMYFSDNSTKIFDE